MSENPAVSPAPGSEEKNAAASIEASATGVPAHSIVEIQAWLVRQIANLTFINEAEIGLSADFNSFGLSSREAVLLSGDLEEWLGVRLSPTLLYEYPTIEKLAAYLGGAKPQVGAPPSAAASPAAASAKPIADLSEDEAEALLLEKLAALEKKKQ